MESTKNRDVLTVLKPNQTHVLTMINSTEKSAVRCGAQKAVFCKTHLMG